MNYADLAIDSIVVLRYRDYLMEAKLIQKEIYVAIGDLSKEEFSRMRIILEQADGKKRYFSQNIELFDRDNSKEFENFSHRFVFGSEEDAIKNGKSFGVYADPWIAKAKTFLRNHGVNDRLMYYNGGSTVLNKQISRMVLINDQEWRIYWDNEPYPMTITELKNRGIFVNYNDAVALCKPHVVRFSDTTKQTKRKVRVTLMKDMFIEDESDIAIPSGYEIKDVTEL